MGGVGALSTVAIFAMADEIGEPRRRMLALCRALDEVYLEHVHAKQSQASEKQRREAKNRQRR